MTEHRAKAPPTSSPTRARAVIAYRELIVAEKNRAVKVKRWAITWVGPCGSFWSEETYRSAEAARWMAQSCGARSEEIEVQAA